MMELEVSIGKLHLKKMQGSIDYQGVVDGIAKLLKHEDRKDVAALIYEKSLPHGNHTACMSPLTSTDLGYHIVGFLYNMTWRLNAYSTEWEFRMSRDPFTNVDELKDGDPPLYVIGNKKVGASNDAEVLKIIDDCFDVVLPLLQNQWEKEDKSSKSR